MKIAPQPYKLHNKIQHYDWGTKNEQAFIPHLLGTTPEPNLPYAELWIGAHPKAPSEIVIDNISYSLDKVITENPVEMLGEYVLNKFGPTLPFLLKVLSAARALSIQTHPDKRQAVKLHSSDPENYPDDNHKPEVAIAIDSLTAIAGFRPLKEIAINLINYPELLNFYDKLTEDKIFSGSPEIRIETIKELYRNILQSLPEKLSTVILQIRNRLSAQKNLNTAEIQFLEQYNQFGADGGLLSFFFFNIVELKPMQGIFTGPGIPHAYIRGNIVECMANSDNVVRAGLTNKFKDVNTLLGILHYEFTSYPIINEKQKEDEVSYKTPAEEFLVKAYKKENSSHSIITNNKPVIVLVLNGIISISWNDNNSSYNYSKGDSFIIPALVNNIVINTEDSAEYFVVTIP